MPKEEEKKEVAKDAGDWRKKLTTREEMIRFLQSSGITTSGPVDRQTASFK
nr:hypothetical protein [uncultured bacterium]